MNHFTSQKFWDYYNKLPKSVQNSADKSFKLLKTNSKYPSLHFKKIEQFWSIRISKKYRALAVKQNKDLIWFWIGNHSDYDKLVSSS